MDHLQIKVSKNFGVPPERLDMEEYILSSPHLPQKWIQLIKLVPEPPLPSSIPCYLEGKYISYIIWERSLLALPTSYKLWISYIEDRINSLRIILNTFRDDELYSNYLLDEIDEIECVFERALKNNALKRMPKIWISYISFSIRLRRIKGTRLLINSALKALPTSLHHKIWSISLSFAESLIPLAPKVSHHIYKRYYLSLLTSNSSSSSSPSSSYNSTDSNSYFNILKRLDEYEEAFQILIERCKEWSEIPKFISSFGSKLKTIDVEKMIRGIDSGDEGVLISSIANWHLKNGRFSEARNTLRNGLLTCMDIRDFGILFETLVSLEEGLIRIALDKRILLVNDLMDSFERLLGPERLQMISDLLLRLSPNSIDVWIERIERLGNTEGEYRKCLETISSMTKGISKIWIAFAKVSENPEKFFLESLNEKNILKDDLAILYIAYSQYCGEKRGIKASIDIISSSLLIEGLEKNSSLWDCYLDLEELRSLPLCVESAYERMILIGACRPQHIINYFLFLEDHQFLEGGKTPLLKSPFSVLELGIQKFKSVSIEFWKIYLPKFIQSPHATLKKVRDLYERALLDTKDHQFVYEFALAYEKEKGTESLYLNLLRNAAKKCENGKFSFYWRLIDCVIEKKGVIEVRTVFDEAIPTISDPDDLIKLAFRYASIECDLGEWERTRSIYKYLAKEIITTSPPLYKRDDEIWLKWQNFESKFGTEISFRELLRYKRELKDTIPSIQFVSPSSIRNEEELDS